MIENPILPQVNNSQWLKNLKVMIQTQVMTASKITGVMPVLCDCILGKICLLNALPRPLVPLTICQSSNLAGINCQHCKSLRSPVIPAQTSALTLFVPLSASPARSPEGFFTVLSKQVRTHSAHTSMASFPSKGDMWQREPRITEIPVKQFKHLGWCTAKKAVLCMLRFTAQAYQTNITSEAEAEVRALSPLGKRGQRMKEYTHCPVLAILL